LRVFWTSSNATTISQFVFWRKSVKCFKIIFFFYQCLSVRTRVCFHGIGRERLNRISWNLVALQHICCFYYVPAFMDIQFYPPFVKKWFLTYWGFFGPHQMQQPYRNLSFEGKVLNVSKLTEYTWLPRLQLWTLWPLAFAFNFYAEVFLSYCTETTSWRTVSPSPWTNSDFPTEIVYWSRFTLCNLYYFIPRFSGVGIFFTHVRPSRCMFPWNRPLTLSTINCGEFLVAYNF
jgi:hypothetical protein